MPLLRLILFVGVLPAAPGSTQHTTRAAHWFGRPTRAKKLAESCGFQVEGIIRRDYKTTTGELVDLLYYGKLSQA